MLIWPLAMLTIIMGIMKGETRFGPLLSRMACWASRVASPPMPLPIMQPKRVRSTASTSTPESAKAILAAPIISCA